MTHSSLTNGIQLTTDSSPRPSGIDRFIIHHAATTSLAAILSLFQPGGRTVSANYALGSDGTLILAVDEDRRAWTSASEHWDGRAVTIEVANAIAGGSWPVSDAAFDKLARLIADVSLRYGFPINNDTILTHQELYLRYGASYATSCPGDLQRRKGELLALANHYRAGGGAKPTIELEDDMKIVQGGTVALVGEFTAQSYSSASGGQGFSIGANGKTYGVVSGLTLDEVNTLINEARARRAALINEVVKGVLAALPTGPVSGGSAVTEDDIKRIAVASAAATDDALQDNFAAIPEGQGGLSPEEAEAALRNVFRDAGDQSN